MPNPFLPHKFHDFTITLKAIYLSLNFVVYLIFLLVVFGCLNGYNVTPDVPYELPKWSVTC